MEKQRIENFPTHIYGANVSETKTIGREFSEAYAWAVSRMDNQSMMYLLGLVSWPPLTKMYGDLVDDMTLICTLLSKKPMVGYLIARRLHLERDKTHALLSVLEVKGYIRAVGTHLPRNSMVFPADGYQTALQLQPPTPPVVVQTKEILEKIDDDATDTAAILSRLWRVLNTDISLRSSTKVAEDTVIDENSASSDVLSQLWRVLNTDIAFNKSAIVETGVKSQAIEKSEGETAEVMGQLWRVLNTEIAFKRLLSSDSEPVVNPDTSGEAADVMSQLWRVLNTEIAFKRKSSDVDASVNASDTREEAADRLSQLWRVLRAEIALKKHEDPEDFSDDNTDTTGEAADKLTQLWRILNAEITVTLPSDRKKQD